MSDGGIGCREMTFSEKIQNLRDALEEWGSAPIVDGGCKDADALETRVTRAAYVLLADLAAPNENARVGVFMSPEPTCSGMWCSDGCGMYRDPDGEGACPYEGNKIHGPGGKGCPWRGVL